MEVTPLEFCRDLWYQKIRVPGLLYGVVYVILNLPFRTIPACDGQTDRQTDTRRQHIPR